MYNEKDFIKSISKSFAMYKKYGARSTKKLIPIHKYITEVLKNIWGSSYKFAFLSEDTKEASVKGKYYPKNIDITVMKGNKAIFCLGIKFITSNYKQNATNYFENMMGETANIQANQIPYAHLIVMRYATPYYKKNNSTTPSRIEVINKNHIQKYLNLIYDTPQAHRPNEICIFLVDINEKTGKVTPTENNKAFGKAFTQLIENKLSPKNFFKQIENYRKFVRISKL